MTTLDKILIPALIISILTALYGFFGVAAFAAIGTIIVCIGVIALLAWLNHITGGLVGLLFIWIAFFS